MGYTPGFEGPHPSELPVYPDTIQAPSCGHVGYLDRWPGDEVTGPGMVFSCGQLCGQPGSQTFQPDEQETTVAVEARFECERKEAIDQTSVQLVLRASIRGRDNTDWAPYTPAGQIQMTVNGPAAAEFVQGGRYRVTFERVADGE